MIKCKEDLINTYVKNIPELRREFLSLAVKFGFIGSESDVSVSSEEAVVACWNDVIIDNPRVGCWFSYADQIKEECRELTLSDFKPTQAEYVQVTESIFDLRDEFERGELYKPMNDDSYEKITCESKLGELYGYRLIYRRVEKVVDERQEFVDLAISRIDHTNSDDPSYYAGWFERLYDAGCRFVGASEEIE